LDRQLEGLELDKVFCEKISGKDSNRPELQSCLMYLREGDILFVHSLDRLARNMRDLLEIVSSLVDKGVEVRFIKENINFSSDSSAISVLLLNVMGAFAQFELTLIRERQREGIKLARERNAYKGGKPKLTQEQAADIIKRASEGVTKSHLAREYKVYPSTIINYIKRGIQTPNP
jgi:DNA invertase Pin-like site-specific DNA recombinase